MKKKLLVGRCSLSLRLKCDHTLEAWSSEEELRIFLWSLVAASGHRAISQ